MTVRESLIVFLPQRVIIFPFYKFGNEFLFRIFKNLQEWDLLKDKKITGKEKYFKYFVEKEISSIINDITIIFKQLNIKIFTLQKDFIIDSNLLNLIEDKDNLIKHINKIFLKLMGKKYFYKISTNLNFNPSNIMYKNLHCANPTGEEVEFVIKLLKITQNE